MSEHTDPARDVEGLAKVIWAASRADEGTISAAGADVVARAVLASDWLAAYVARKQAETLAEVGRKVYDLPTTRAQAWRNGWNSVSLNDVLGIVRGMAEAGEQ